MRKFLLAACVSSLFATAMPATAQVSATFDAPGVSIGINVGTYPQLVPIPGYPVYYAPQLSTNYFFYDGMYWVYVNDNWYMSAWYDGPWELVAPVAVPLYILRVPVRYYRRPPPYFRVWVASAPPHWGEHWGHSWEESRRGWDRWDRSAAPAPAPLPTYQRQYSGNRYPQIQQQQALQQQHYSYRPRDAVAQQYYQRVQTAAPSGRGQAVTPSQGRPPQPGVAGQTQPVQPAPPAQARRGRGENAPNAQTRDQQQAQQRQAEQAQRARQQTEQTQRGQQQAQQRQAEQAQRSQQQAQQRQAEQVQRGQQQAQQRQAEQAQRGQQQAQQRQGEQAQRAQEQAQQRQEQQPQRAQQQAPRQQRDQSAQQGKGQERKEQQGG